jgi:hypothetical protein
MGKKATAVIPLMRLVWDKSQASTSHSWERLNASMRKALTLAVGAGLEFAAKDFGAMTQFRPDHWVGESWEWVYSLAVAEGNTSAAVAFEEWKGRPPIIADGVYPGSRHTSFAHKAGLRQQERLHVGCYFRWQGLKVKVTSFTAEGEAVACSYHPAKGQYDHERRVARVFKITREAVIENRAERKEKAAIQKELLQLITEGRVDNKKIIDSLGAKTKDEFDALPVAKVRRVATKFRKAA